MNFLYDSDNDLINPPEFGYYKYWGSRTQPPCEESTTWFIVAEIIPVSSTVLTMIRDVLNIPL